MATSYADVFWRIFETTGSIAAYLIYRQLVRSNPS
ncbi:MAG: YqzL family protein [Firmicutes bacterium]|nr:YqzL family protein [Bacillota bacterium]